MPLPQNITGPEWEATAVMRKSQPRSRRSKQTAAIASPSHIALSSSNHSIDESLPQHLVPAYEAPGKVKKRTTKSTTHPRHAQIAITTPSPTIDTPSSIAPSTIHSFVIVEPEVGSARRTKANTATRTTLSPSRESVPNMEESTGDVVDSDSPPAKIRRPRNDDKFEKDFASEQEAKEFVSVEGCWAVRNRSESMEGAIICYRCNRVKARGKKCASALYLLLDTFGPQTSLYRSNEHTCLESSNKAGTYITADVRDSLTGR